MEFFVIAVLVLAFGIPVYRALNIKIGKEFLYASVAFAAFMLLLGIISLFRKPPEPAPNLFAGKQPRLTAGAVDVEFIGADRVFPPGENIHAVKLNVVNRSELWLAQMDVRELGIGRSASQIARGTIRLDPPLEPGSSRQVTTELRYKQSFSPSKSISFESVVTTNGTRYYW